MREGEGLAEHPWAFRCLSLTIRMDYGQWTSSVQADTMRRRGTAGANRTVTEALERAYKEARRLPEREQREIAELIEQKLADLRWDTLLARPESDELLRELATEAIEEDDAGLTRESGETW